jgi:hypothetical protein
MSEGGCNICDPEMRKAAAAGRPVQFPVKDNRCARCTAAPRIRAMAYALDKRGRDLCRKIGLEEGGARGLLAAPMLIERSLIAPFLKTATTCSLYGSYGNNHVNCDLRDLAPFDDASFDLFEACDVLDFIPDFGDAIASVSRVLAKRAAVFVYYTDGRFRERSLEPPVVVRRKTEFHADYYPPGYEQSVVNVGREWFAREWARHGFTMEQVTWNDPYAKRPLVWWMGTRS